MKFVLELASLSFCLAIKEPPPDPTKIKLPAVPPVQNAGYAGFPALPKVDIMMEDTSKAMDGFNLRAQQLQKRVMQAQKQRSLRLQKQKAVFDGKLQEQEEENQVVVRDNQALAHRLMDAKKSTHNLWQKAVGLQESGEQRRQQLVLLQEQVKRMEEFLAESLALEDQQLPEGDVLAEVSAKPQAGSTSEGLSFLQEDELTDQETGNLLQTSTDAEAEADPENLVSVLKHAVDDMKAQGKKSEHRLKEIFLQDFKAGSHRKKALLQQQKVLESTLGQMNNYQQKIVRAEKYMQEKAEKGLKRMHGAGKVLQRLGQLAELPATEALSELSALKTNRRKLHH
eukprot:TRINITY_DN25080_c0_g2_i1.p1 TRINITY_DN25080_c0_g2~~TRINITY_DN25080_c0_g2_i1.p1  ORF type:complete len:340 (+),score=111.96 TRINITY_DN25080_c0_g2_i1:81-1100(+)